MLGIPLLVLVLGYVEAGVRVDPLVQTDQGLIRGLEADDGDYSMFMGIPYGKLKEDNPFGAAEPYPKFDQIFNAVDDTAKCPQTEEFNNTLTGTLDCLHLNIYVPNKASSRNKLPVLVWIHGGGFFNGFSGRYVFGPKFYVRNDIILITLNYRLGPYGFMCLDTPDVPGNQGLKDQRLALRWIKNNIASFGGDINKVTLMGESAGSVSVELQLMAKQERLFNQVILQSGSAFGPWAVGSSDVTAPLRLAEKLGHATEDLDEAIAFLAKADPKLLIAATSELFIGFGPCLEKEFDDVESILTEHPLIAEMANVRNTKVLAGFNNKEQLVSFATRPASAFEGLNVFSSIRGSFVIDDEDNFQSMEDIVRRFYIGDEEVTEAVRWNLMEFESDWTFNYPTQWSIDNYLEKGASDVFYYVFSYSGERNFVKSRFNVTEEGASHADELGYQFDMALFKETPSADDQRIIDQITTLWANFVKYGEPTPETSELLPVKWTPVTKDTYTYLELDEQLSVKRRPYSDRLSFWQLFFKTNWHRLKAIGIYYK
ncbi:cholinesterase-like [Maniola hyperantus]|uniref:cholinesterase-like n=1 Tax=Aphantopus hyperantus TaxID=2795564 RepID=UPI001569B0E6|nr:cholinesterase-like [Maniola hyperantus]